MDNTIFFEHFGLNAKNFVNRHYERIITDKGRIYEVEEDFQLRICPFCQHEFMNIHSKRWMHKRLSSTIECKDELRILRIRYKCPNCGKTHTFDLDGLPRNKTLTEQNIRKIQLEFYELQSFKQIAKRYGVSVQTIINIFDESTRYIPRKKLPKYLCIDEKRFEGDTAGKYCVVLSDFFTGEVIDILPDRQMPYLNDYFSNISPEERQGVNVIISDMYEGYSTIKDKYFPKASFVVDLFHVVKLLSNAVNKLRIRTYNQIAIDDTLERHFLKTHWKIFLCDYFKIRKEHFYSKKYDQFVNYGDVILSCLKMNPSFWDGYSILQELIHYDKYTTFSESLKFIDRMIAKLNTSGDELLEKVAATYKKWRVGIANGLAKNQTGKRYSNSIAENNNSHIQRVINVAYGYSNFKRFRARVMLLLTYKKAKVMPYW